jgi:hypothetical protein
LVGSNEKNSPQDLRFDYLNAQNVWQSETIIANTLLRDFDFSVLNGIPVVSFVNAQSPPNLGLYFGMRRANGVWETKKIADTNPVGLYGTSLFEQNGRVGIAYWQSSDNTLRVIMQVPEPSSFFLALLAGALIANCKRRPMIRL